MNIPAVLIANVTGILLMILIIASNHKNTRYGLFDENIYNSMAIMTILQCVIEAASYIIDGKTYVGYIPLAYILNSSLYIINIIFAYFWTIYADYKLFEDKERLKRMYTYIGIPALIISIGALVNLVTPVFYEISSQNVYSRTSLYIIPYIFTYGYLLYGVVLIYKYRNTINKYLFMPAIMFMIPILLGSLLQFAFYGYSLVWLGVSVAMVSLYVNVQNEASYIDITSGLFTRQYLYNYLSHQVKKANRKNHLMGIMLDIDRFKSINDQYGHITGDHAIASAGRLLHSVVEKNGLAVRYAGDEFIILQYVNSEMEIVKLIQNLHKKTDEFNLQQKDSYHIHFSNGYALYQENETIDHFIQRMDQEMYKDKKRKIEENKIMERRSR